MTGLEIIGIVSGAASVLGIGFGIGYAVAQTKEKKILHCFQAMELMQYMDMEDETLNDVNEIALYFGRCSCHLSIELYYAHLTTGMKLFTLDQTDQICGHFHFVFAWLQRQEHFESSRHGLQEIREHLNVLHEWNHGMPLPQKYLLKETEELIKKSKKEGII